MRSKRNAALLSILLLASLRTVAAQHISLPIVPLISTAIWQTQTNTVQLVIEGKVIKVHDGDTVTVLDKDNKKFSIRLQGIDAPELKQAYGSPSQENLSRMVLDKQVMIVWTKVDKYRRTVGTIMLDGRDINIEQVKAGLAWHFKKYADEQDPQDRVTYAKAEESARAAKLGLWQAPDPTPPGEYRVDVKLARWGPPPPEGTIIGNRQSKKYHRPDCAGYRDMAEKNRVFFKSVPEAEAAGYKRAGNCPPEGETSSATVATVGATPQTKPQAERTGTTRTATPDTSTRIAATPEGAIIGNKNSKVYHNPGCPGYNAVSEKNRVYFKSIGEAESAGYKKAGNCKADESSAAVVTTPVTGPSPSKESAPSATTVAASTSAQATPASTTTGEIIGNKNSKIYHRPDCPGYKSVSEKNQVKFKSAEEAEAGGYRAAKNCP